VTAQVNLLPARYAEQLRERRWAALAAGGLLVLLLLLGLVAVGQSRRLARAESARATEQARTQALSARRAELVPFRELTEGIVQRERVLAASMQTQVSWAGVLARLSAAFPPATALTSLSAESTVPAASVAPPAAPADATRVIGTLTFSGYSVQAFAPGVAGVLQSLGAVTGLSEPHLVTADRGEIGEAPVTTFDGGALVNGAALTKRYAEGLPPGERVDVPRVTPAAAAGTPTAGTGGGG
jgi:Tfp pilus assembly protein PilN